MKDKKHANVSVIYTFKIGGAFLVYYIDIMSSVLRMDPALSV